VIDNEPAGQTQARVVAVAGHHRQVDVLGDCVTPLT
jgi:hypothetical protein